MSDLDAMAAEASKAWADLLKANHSPQERACLDTATAQTDRLWVLLHDGSLGPGSPFLAPRDGHWCRLALSAYELLTTGDAYAHLTHARTYTCAAVDTAIESWLRSPAQQQPGDPADDSDERAAAPTVAETLGLSENRVEPAGVVSWLSTVAGAAQDARVFGVPRHRVDVLPAPTPPGPGDAMVRVVVDAPHGPALASAAVPVSDLVDVDGSRGIDAAVTALTRLAGIVDDLFTAQQKAVWHAPPPRDADQATAGRGFPQLRIEQAAAPPRTRKTPSPSARSSGKTR